MKELLARVFLKNWPRKAVALVCALFVWFLVNQTITITQTLTDVPIRVIHLPPEKTVIGLLSNGLLNKRVSVTITGKRSVVEDLHPTDIEVVINANDRKESWIASINKKNLVSLNPDIDLAHNITEVSANDLFIPLSRLITEEIPVIIRPPIGDPPKGYRYLEVWPKLLLQKTSGPEEEVRALKESGLEVTFNLNRITEAELDTLFNKQGKRDEITYMVPESWRKVSIPFKDHTLESLNDPRADLLRIDFLKQELLPIGVELPITIFFPVSDSQTINPQTYSLATNQIIQKKNGLKLLTIPLYVRDVSHLFLDVIRDHLLLIVVAAPQGRDGTLSWAVEFIDDTSLEEAFVRATLKQVHEMYAEEEPLTKSSEEAIRDRFREYKHQFVLYNREGKPLHLKAHLNANTILLEQE